MPNAGPLRRQAEREFYYTQLGGSFPQQTIDALARQFYVAYFNKYGGLPARWQSVPLDSFELLWLKRYIQQSGGTLPNQAGQHPVGFRSSLWRQALVVSGLAAQASRNMNDNRYTFYLNNKGSVL